MRKAPLFLMLIASLMFIPAAEAKIRDKSWEFGALVGNIDGDRDAGIGNGISGELRFGYSFSEKVSAEVSLSDETRAVQWPRLVPGPRNSLRLTGLRLTRAEQGNTPDFLPLGRKAIREPACPDPNTDSCWSAISRVTPDINKDVEFRRAIAVVTGNFLTDRETRTIPYLSAGIGFIQETREGYPFVTHYTAKVVDPNNPTGPRIDAEHKARGKVLESFDSSAVLTLAVGARTFLTDNWGVRYEVAYMHHNSFELNQNEYAVRVGATWVIGGQK